MRIESISGATIAPPILLQAERVRRRISASDSVTALLASLAYGEPRSDGWIWPVAADRTATASARGSL